MTYQTLRRLLFHFDPEHVHGVAEKALHVTGMIPWALTPAIRRYFVDDPRLHQRLFGRTFLHPVGLAAGFDKDGTMVRALAALGFGHVEVGTVTPRPQEGNEKPRLFRHVAQESLQNAMGFNNAGSTALQKRLQSLHPYALPLGVNIGKNKATAPEHALEDYGRLLQMFGGLCDYLVINLSSPNTPGLRDLQNEAFISALFEKAAKTTTTPVLIKIAPDMEVQTALDLCDAALKAGASGIIATNTTTDYGLIPGVEARGGLSGAVLKEKSFALFAQLGRAFFGKTTLISVGGIDSPEEAWRRITHGASLIQIYTALIYHGPDLLRRINLYLLQQMDRAGYATLDEAIGSALSQGQSESSL